MNMIQLKPDMFDDIELYDKIDKDLCITEIFKRCGELPCIDFNPDLFKLYSDAFFKKNFEVFKNLCDSMYYEYEPLENLNRYDETERNINNESHGTDSNITGQERKVSAMNSDEYQPDSDTTTDSSGMNDVNYSGSDKYTAHSHGTIGVITTQDMIEKQRKVVRYEVYSEIAAAYEKEMFVRIY